MAGLLKKQLLQQSVLQDLVPEEDMRSGTTPLHTSDFPVDTDNRGRTRDMARARKCWISEGSVKSGAAMAVALLHRREPVLNGRNLRSDDRLANATFRQWSRGLGGLLWATHAP